MLLFVILKVNLILKILQVMLISSLKFIVAPPVSIEIGLNYFQTIIFTTAGGIAGVVFFYHLSGWLIRMYYKYLHFRVKAMFTGRAKLARMRSNLSEKKIKIFSRRSRGYIKLKRNWGLIGIALLTPSLLSIPLGAFLANKFYSKNKSTLIYLSASVALWSVIFSTVYFYSFS
jgi:hypothetical protein